MPVFPFQILGGVNSTASGAVGTSSSQIALPAISSMGCDMALTNIGTQPVFVAYGSVTANVTSCMPVLPNSKETITVPAGTSQLSVIAPSAGSTLYCTIGKGL